jgi:uncharacterized MAPEG superfamily protein
MLLAILATLALLWILTIIPGRALTKQVGTKEQMGPRDNLPPPSQELIRARNTLANFLETLPIFMTLALLTLHFGVADGLATIGAYVYLVARIVHAVCYLRGLSPWRSLAYLVGLVGLFIMAIPLLQFVLG